MKKIRPNILLLTRLLVILMLSAISHQLLAITHYPLPSNDSIIDVPKYLIAGWYKGVDKEPFDSTKWYRNTAFTVTLNPEALWERGRYKSNLFNFAFYFTKEYNPSTAYSFGLSFANSDNAENFSRFGVDFGYIWNLTNFYYGLDRTRRYNLSATTGAEFGSVSFDSYKKKYYGGYLGLRFSRTFTPHTTFFLEPRVGLYSDSYDAMDNPVGLDAMATAHFGMNYKLSEMLNIVPERRKIGVMHENNWFIEMAGDVFLPVPKAEYIYPGSAYSDRINYGANMAVGFRVNPLSSGRLRFTYSKDRFVDARQYIAAIDLLVSGTNMFLGENEKRYVDMGVALGPLMQFTKYPDEDVSHLSWGAELGLQFTRRITPAWELFVEPRFQLVQDYSKGETTDYRLRKRWDVSSGMVYLYGKREKQRFNEWAPFQHWYLQTLFGAQVSELTSGHQIGMFDFSVGRSFGPLFSLRASVFSGELKSKEPNYDATRNPMYVTYYGGRMEMVSNLLNMMAPEMYDSKWDFNISTGVEFGRLTNYYNKTWAIVAGSQLKYRFTDKAWIVAGGRVEQPLKFDAQLPVSGHLGMQYDMKDNKRIDILRNYWRPYVQGGIGYHNAFFNNDMFAYNAAVGINITPAAGVRIEYIGSKTVRDEDGHKTNWTSISPEYVLNLSNYVFGEDDKRRVDLSLFTGLDFMIHKNMKVGFNLGSQVDTYLGKNLALYVEPRFSYQPFDRLIAPTDHDQLQYHTFIGLRYTHDRFYTVRDQDLYRDLFGDKDVTWLEDLKRKWENWHPFENIHPKEYIKRWHPQQNLRVINAKIMHDDWHPLQKLYFQANWGAQLPTLTGGHQQGSFDFTIGRKMRPLWSVQASIFSGGLQSEEPNFDETNNPMFVAYYGGRAEVVFNFFRLLSVRLKDSRWNMNVAGGLEYGRLTNHHKNDYALVGSGQLMYRLTSNMWLTAGGRYEHLANFNAKLPLSGICGIQYDFNNEKRYDMSANKWRWYVQTGSGFRHAFFNMDNIDYNFAAGININPRHGFRIEYIITEKHKNADGEYTNWMSISPEYVFNATNKIFGVDDKRRLDMEFFTGLDLMKHKSGFSNMKIGYNAGIQVNAHITKYLSVFVQPRISYQPSDMIIAPTTDDKFQVMANFGIRYSHLRFGSDKEKKNKDKEEDIELDWN